MVRFALAIALVLAAHACSESTATNQPGALARFEVEVSGEKFVVAVATQAQAEAMRARLQSGTRGVVIGTLAAGHGGFNAPWAWHLTTQSATTADLAIELCDGRPSMVSADLAYWLGSVRQFCPWGARVTREL
ncbi:MAG: hypothetical protein IT361_13645 [Gemmatimonadaceae bacterium]|nr:hypothetical protein [Gemmatimonadaceae bacterium]